MGYFTYPVRMGSYGNFRKNLPSYPLYLFLITCLAEEQSGGAIRAITQFYNVEECLSFQEFNRYINSLDKPTTIKKK